MIDKRTLILESIIREYLKNPEPIGSEQLKITLDIKISSATIRNYLKKMVDNGDLAQQHISSGRVPTDIALTKYWSNRLSRIDTLFFYDINTMTKKAKEIDIFFIAKIKESNKLIGLLKNQNFLVLIFENTQIVMEYSLMLEQFLSSIMFYSIEDIRAIVAKVGIMQLVEKIDNILESGYYYTNAKVLMNMATRDLISEEFFMDTIKGKNFDQISDGVHFDSLVPNGYMALKSDVFIAGREAKLLCVGELSKNFDYFFSL